MGVKLPLYPLISTENGEKTHEKCIKMYKIFFFKLYASKLIEGSLKNKYHLLTLYKGLNYPHILLYRLEIEKNVKKSAKNL